MAHRRLLAPLVASTAGVLAYSRLQQNQQHQRRPALCSEKAAPAKKFSVVFVLGGPGAGKGTNCEMIVRDFGFMHLSAGDLLRALRDSGSKEGDMINQMIKEGKIVDASITVGLLRNAMLTSGKTTFLVDGFPRDMANLECWNRLMTDVADVEFLLFLDCPDDVMTARLLERGKTSGRNDDNIESIRKRLATYNSDTRPIIEFFKQHGKAKGRGARRGGVVFQ